MTPASKSEGSNDCQVRINGGYILQIIQTK